MIPAGNVNNQKPGQSATSMPTSTGSDSKEPLVSDVLHDIMLGIWL